MPEFSVLVVEDFPQRVFLTGDLERCDRRSHHRGVGWPVGNVTVDCTGVTFIDTAVSRRSTGASVWRRSAGTPSRSRGSDGSNSAKSSCLRYRPCPPGKPSGRRTSDDDAQQAADRGAAGRSRFGMGGRPPRRSERDLAASHPTRGHQGRQATRGGKRPTSSSKGSSGRVRARSSYRDAHPPDRRRRRFVPDLDREPLETRFHSAAQVPLAAPLLDRIDAALASTAGQLLHHVAGRGRDRERASDPAAVDLMDVAQALETVMRPGHPVVPGPRHRPMPRSSATRSSARGGLEVAAARSVSRPVSVPGSSATSWR